MDDASMNHILEAADFPGGTIREIDKAAPKQGMARIPWENYVRCLFLTIIIGMIGYMAWRPSMLRLSALRSLVSPSHGDSLAWSPSEEATSPLPQAIKTPSPAEWRLSSTLQTSGDAVRPQVDRFFVWRGARMSRPQWRRFSHSSWDWRDSIAFGSKRKEDHLGTPPQKPASSFRAGPSWNTTARPTDTLAATQPAPSAPAPVAMPASIAAPLEASTPASAAQPMHIPDFGPTESRQEPPAATRIGEETAAALPSLVEARTTDVAEAASAAPSPLSTPEPIQAMAESTGTTGMRQRETASVTVVRPTAAPDQVQPSALLQKPARTEIAAPEKTQAPDKAEATEKAETTERTEAPEQTKVSEKTEEKANAPAVSDNWADREIVEAIPGAYLTIYPKLKFVGLCVPGQNYIRKYNQIAVPHELSGPKTHSMDGKTPYGKYYIAGHRRDAAGPRLILSWPSPDDARRIGLAPAIVAEIENAWLSQTMPPQTTAAGGGVYLTGLRSQIDATDGSFALEEPHLEEIFTALPDGAWVFIQE